MRFPATAFPGNAAADGIEAEFAYLEALEPIDLVKAKGKIVFIAGGVGPEGFGKLIDAGVLGFISPSGTFRETKDSLDLDERCFGRFTLKRGSFPASAFA